MSSTKANVFAAQDDSDEDDISPFVVRSSQARMRGASNQQPSVSPRGASSGSVAPPPSAASSSASLGTQQQHAVSGDGGISGSGGGGGDGGGDPLPSPRNSGVRATIMDVTAYTLHDDEPTDVAGNVKAKAETMFDTLKKRTSMFRANLTTQAWMFIVIVTVCVITLWGCSCALLYEAFHTNTRWTTVGDGLGMNMCSSRRWSVYLTTSASYSMSDLMLGSFFSLWYAFRAVRHEKEALLVVFALCVVGVVGRAIYFSFVTANYWVTGLSLVGLQVFLCLGSFGLLVAVGLTWRVGRSFGWRMYTKGVASVEDVDRMGRLKTLDACAKLDLFLTCNAFNTFFFFAPDRSVRYVGFACTVITALLLLAIPVMVKKRMFFVSYLFVVVGLVLPAFYIYILVSILGQESRHCYDNNLLKCTANSNITQVVGMTTNFTNFPSLISSNNTIVTSMGNNNASSPFVSSACIDCLGEVDMTFAPQRLCWNRTFYNGGGVAGAAAAENATQCASAALNVIGECCRAFGKCELKEKLVDSNSPMAIFVVVCAIITRICTIIFGIQQARRMDMPSVEEMFRRAERNVKEFTSSALSFTFLGSSPAAQQQEPSMSNLNTEEMVDTSRTEASTTGAGAVAAPTPAALAAPGAGKKRSRRNSRSDFGGNNDTSSSQISSNDPFRAANL